MRLIQITNLQFNVITNWQLLQRALTASTEYNNVSGMEGGFFETFQC